MMGAGKQTIFVVLQAEQTRLGNAAIGPPAAPLHTSQEDEPMRTHFPEDSSRLVASVLSLKIWYYYLRRIIVSSVMRSRAIAHRHRHLLKAARWN